MKTTVLIFVSLLIASFLGSGCAEVIGLEEREQAPGVIDEETERITSESCVEYCDTVMEACTGELAVYTTRRTCIDVCNALDPGTDTEPAGNTVACRKRQANLALQGEAGEFCPDAGPSGGAACDGPCPAWCQLLSEACPEDHEALSDCESSCPALEDVGTFNVDEFYTGDTIQCRLIHVSAAFDDDVHCEHAKFQATENCINEEHAGEPSCEAYCRNVAGACRGELAVYESTEQCLSVCRAFPRGELGDMSGNTVGCRQYHAGAALAGPEVHCPHASPTGDGMCADDNIPGICDSYCLLRAEGCGGQDRDVCRPACDAAFSDAGAEDGSGYSVETAEEEGGIQCRFLYLSRALNGDADACESTGAADSCP